ncbi:hypothetical protein FOCG_14843 [Fusarium oxysporum f. sp. radicis-lycopersici 26381]|uniref:Uncharacterized protein n=1 Tax=Fusarium oxysporum Fo47 TaxID=660027 RepID=W9JWC4_FUSOX|nr:hypothetical protein FOZG_13253 [Fusarium oxysporum Fo47]EXL42372.1 hypothetical protein FOCG_14843 [Fusarium oxysporum f. sp. radicis-lycopersici 26381]
MSIVEVCVCYRPAGIALAGNRRLIQKPSLLLKS